MAAVSLVVAAAAGAFSSAWAVIGARTANAAIAVAPAIIFFKVIMVPRQYFLLSP